MEFGNAQERSLKPSCPAPLLGIAFYGAVGCMGQPNLRTGTSGQQNLQEDPAWARCQPHQFTQGHEEQGLQAAIFHPWI